LKPYRDRCKVSSRLFPSSESTPTKFLFPDNFFEVEGKERLEVALPRPAFIVKRQSIKVEVCATAADKGKLAPPVVFSPDTFILPRTKNRGAKVSGR